MSIVIYAGDEPYRGIMLNLCIFLTKRLAFSLRDHFVIVAIMLTMCICIYNICFDRAKQSAESKNVPVRHMRS